ncbi:hypothetical protein LWI29_032353 [Acer saccharum]|uniref:Uncharacterized protein n=1 Tax=Acer saccharum TaxID=4024 RepID=A0AA39S9X4_ACESA|nr:hypothetical protein LWI29_032353 [Acer saccharum]
MKKKEKRKKGEEWPRERRERKTREMAKLFYGISRCLVTYCGCNYECPGSGFNLKSYNRISRDQGNN